MEEREILEYQNLLKFIAGESPDGRERVQQLQKTKDDFLKKYGTRDQKKRLSDFFLKKQNLDDAKIVNLAVSSNRDNMNVNHS